MRLLILPRYVPLGASSRLRMYQYLPALRASGFEAEISPLLGEDYLRGLYAGKASLASILRGYRARWRSTRDLREYDLVWVEKEAWPWLPHALERQLLGGVSRLVLDYDDAVFHRYDEHRSPLVRGLLGDKLDRLMRAADMVTAGNDYLAERARAAGCARVEWLPTVIDLARYPDATPKPATVPVTVGWIGSPATAGYLRQVADALTPLRDEGLIRCVAIGARADQLLGTPFEAAPWSDETEVEALRAFDIGIMPLPDAPWERGKCGYKLIQYMACGLPVVASPVGVNTTIVRPDENGWLADTPEQWAAAIRHLAEDAGLRQQMGAAGRRQVEDTYCLQAQASRLIGMLREGVAGA